MKNAMNVSDAELEERNQMLQSTIQEEKEAWLVAECQSVLEKRSRWGWDYSTPDAYEQSVEPFRELWRDTIGEIAFEGDLHPKVEPYFEDDSSVATWLSIDLLPDLKARAVLALPKKNTGPFPLVVALHGMLGSPAGVFGFDDPVGDAYHGYGRELLNKGFAVLAPANVNASTPRIRIHRLCFLLGGTIIGLEIGKVRRLLDHVLTLPEIDSERIGVWGISLGGLYTMCIAALDKRIKTAIMCAFFMDRFQKAAIQSPHYSSWFLPHEEHLWIPGWFKGGFTDSNVLSLVCPRALQITEGKEDITSWWPLQKKEYQKLRKHYVELGIEDKTEFVCHDGGHEIALEPGLRFLEKTLV